MVDFPTYQGKLQTYLIFLLKLRMQKHAFGEQTINFIQNYM